MYTYYLVNKDNSRIHLNTTYLHIEIIQLDQIFIYILFYRVIIQFSMQLHRNKFRDFHKFITNIYIY